MKATKQSADYSRGTSAEHCGKLAPDDRNHCHHFVRVPMAKDGGCELVQGVIRADYWCDKYEKA